MKLSSFPLTLGSSALLLIAWAIPPLGPLLEMTLPVGTGAVASGFTCHWVHWSLSHLGHDLLFWIPLSALIERRSASQWWLLVLCASAGVSFAVATFTAELSAYRGISGVVCGFLGAWCGGLLFAPAGRGGALRLFGGTALVLSLVKVFCEARADAPLFATGDFVSVPTAHLAGLAVGLVIAGASRFLSNPNKLHALA